MPKDNFETLLNNVCARFDSLIATTSNSINDLQTTVSETKAEIKLLKKEIKELKELLND